ncbi:MAG TPA: hypothetical protein VHE37_08365 [Nevskiaceae bacterium]|nr:hypothetical protein [Nevskiaceae bacterium]
MDSLTTLVEVVVLAATTGIFFSMMVMDWLDTRGADAQRPATRRRGSALRLG